MFTRIVKLLSLVFLFSCSHLQSGRYVQLREGETLEDLAHAFEVSAISITQANQGKNFKAGEWIFIPETRGLGQLFSELPAYSKFVTSEEFLRTGKFLWPVPQSVRISSHFGHRRGRPHEGIDIPGARNLEIVASEDGEVIYSDDSISGYGNMTIIAHAGGIRTVYAHAHKNFTSKGDVVKRGQVIALMGNTGRSTGDHLHFEIRYGDRAVNPIAYVEKSRQFIMASR